MVAQVKIPTDQTYCYQCPLCKAWQMDYSIDMMMREFGQFSVGPDGTFKPEMGAMEQVIEDVLQEHLAEAHPGALRRYKKTGKLL